MNMGNSIMKILWMLLNISITLLTADITYKDNKWHSGITDVSFILAPEECNEALEGFAQSASNLSFCSILHSKPIRLCEKCIDQYVNFLSKYQELKTKVVNGTTCGDLFMSQDRLNVVMDYYNNIAAVWTKGNCYNCYDWDGQKPTLKNNTITFYQMYNNTKHCISNESNECKNTKHCILNDTNVCEKCFDKYMQLDSFYKTLSSDGIGVDSVCMDIVDSMNATRAIWSKDLNCCVLRRKPEIAFLCCASILSVLPFIYYLAVRFYGPIRDLPNVLNQSRFKQSFLKSKDPIN